MAHGKSNEAGISCSSTDATPPPPELWRSVDDKVRRSSKLPGSASYDAKLSISIKHSVSIIGAVTRFCGFKPNANEEDTLHG